MGLRAIVISGKVGTGKSSLARRIANALNARLVRSKDLILQLKPRTIRTRRAMQLAGQRLDHETNGKWLTEALSQQLATSRGDETIVVDSVRIAAQVAALRRSGWVVTHIHLEASDGTLERRYEIKRTQMGELKDYETVSRNWTEKHVNELGNVADTVIDAERCSEDDVYCRVMARLIPRPMLLPPVVDVLVGGQYGSEGKGNIADHLAPDYDVLVRVGSINAGHKVFRPGGAPYPFRQLPSGALGNPDAVLVLGAGTVIGLDVLLREISELAIPVEKLIIDRQASIISPRDKRWEERTVGPGIGSTAQGVGRATARKILGRTPGSSMQLAETVPQLQHFVRDTVDYFAECYSKGQRILLEGTQGTSLSLHHGFYPHVTSRMTTADACLAEAGLASRFVRRVVMVCRTYPIRVGDSTTGKTSGFMDRPITFEEIARRARLSAEDIKKSEVGSVSGRPRRIGEFDWSQLRRSLLLNGPTDLALTFADYIDVNNRKAFRYEQLTNETLRFIEELEAVCGIPVSLISTDFSERNIIDRRSW